MTARGALSEQAFYILSALAGEALYGYAIVSTVAELSAGRIRLRVGTLYGLLDRMTADGWIELDREEVVSSRLRRYYRLTSDGQHVLTRETARQAANARMAARRLGSLGVANPAAPS